MRNPDRPIREIDERVKSRDEIEEMIANMFKNDEDGYPENHNPNQKTA